LHQGNWGQNAQNFYTLGPDEILDSLQKLGIPATGQFFQMNSMENRVYQVQVEKNFVIEDLKGRHLWDESWNPDYLLLKFYRPARWSIDQITEELIFEDELFEQEIPVIPALKVKDQLLHKNESLGLHFTIYPHARGRSPEELKEDDFLQIGRTLARLHSQGNLTRYTHRVRLDADHFIRQGVALLEHKNLIPSYQLNEYRQLTSAIAKIADEKLNGAHYQRLHGDFHRGNLLKYQDKISLLDFDDSLSAPTIQDIWPILPDRHGNCQQELQLLAEGYEEIKSFPWHELELIEVLRTLRLINFNVWLALRWEDPAFKQAFPYFGEATYWMAHLEDIQRQFYLIQEQIH
jgi:Ser/Thr protein kinase RdoA (MazF antagonist)